MLGIPEAKEEDDEEESKPSKKSNSSRMLVNERGRDYQLSR